MKKTIYLSCLLCLASMANAATISESNADPLNLGLDAFNGDDFAISYTISGITADEFIQKTIKPGIFSWILSTGKMPIEIEFNRTNKYWEFSQMGGFLKFGDVNKDITHPFSETTFVFQYDVEDSSASYSLSYLTNEDTLANLILWEDADPYTDFADTTAEDLQVQFYIEPPMNDYVSDITVWEGVVEASDLVARDTPAVPEPTTATLSLLALAGLVARRRRK